jgi:hypothetical protein
MPPSSGYKRKNYLVESLKISSSATMDTVGSIEEELRSTLKMQAAGSFETLVTIWKTVWCRMKIFRVSVKVP